MNNRRDFIKKTSMLGALSMIASPLKSFGILHKNLAEDGLIGHGAYTYKVDKAWAQISVNSNPLFNCHEMVQDSQGRLIMLGDNIHNNILIFDKSGKLLDHWGNAYPGGHGLSIGKDGDEDFLMITDCGWFQDKTGKYHKQGGQVVKTTLDGRMHFAIGHPKTIGIYTEDDPFMPTETTVAPNGDIYVADGYGSDYIIQYNSDGQYIRHFGGHNNENPDHNLSNAHGVAIDERDPAYLKLICTSRNENCFKVFTLDGKFIERVDLPGMHVCRPVLHGKNIYAGVCWSKDSEGNTDWGDSGFVTILDENNKVVSNPGGTAPKYTSGKLQAATKQKNPVFDHGHDVCVDEDDNIYVCQWNAKSTTPIKLTRV
ncbi:MAG: hypothetical protein ACI9IP_000085 [Arcticibacterium sp.]|jgi:hypothetical protein